MLSNPNSSNTSDPITGQQSGVNYYPSLGLVIARPVLDYPFQMNPEVEFQNLLGQIDFVINALDAHRDLLSHNQVNQFYYMEKKAELLFLSSQIKCCEARVIDLKRFFDSTCREVESKSKGDVAWLKKYTGAPPVASGR